MTPTQQEGVDNSQVAFHRRSAAVSLIGSIVRTQNVLDVCAEHRIGPGMQVIPIDEIKDAHKATISGDVRFRYVIDIASSRDEAA